MKKKNQNKVKDAAVFSKKTSDGFINLALKLGVGTPGTQAGVANALSNGAYQFNLVTRNRVLLEAAYRGSWVVGRVVDCTAEDMTRAGILLTTSKGADKIQELTVQFSRLQIWQSIADTIKWGRLYGGCVGVLQIEGQDLESPLDSETIEEGQFLGIAVYDRWQLNPVLSSVIMSGPDIGLPAYYDIVLGSNLNDPGQVIGQGSLTKTDNVGQAGGPSSNRVRVHHTRLFRMGGYKLPFFQAITEMMWEQSVIERMYDRLIEFETSNSSSAGLIQRALLRTVQVDGFRDVLSAGGEAKEGMLEMFEMMRMFQSNEGMTLLDKNDTFSTYQYTFAGLSDLLSRFGEQIAGASETPLTRLLGQTPGGFSSGDSDIRNYYDGINAKQESRLRNPIELLLKVMWRSCFGEPLPSDVTFKFMPLWQMSDKEKAEIAASKTTAIISAHQEGGISTQTMMKELKQMANDTGVFSNITDEEIEQSENEEPPMPDEAETEPKEEPGQPGESPAEPKEIVKKMGINSKDSAWKKFKSIFNRGMAQDTQRSEPAIGASNKKRKLTTDQKLIADWISK